MLLLSSIHIFVIPDPKIGVSDSQEQRGYQSSGAPYVPDCQRHVQWTTLFIFIWVVSLPLLSWTTCWGCLLIAVGPPPCMFCIRSSLSWWKASTSTMSRFASLNLSKVKVHEKKYKMSLTHEVPRMELRVAVFFSENHFKRAFQRTSKQAYYIQVKSMSWNHKRPSSMQFSLL